MSNGQIEKQNAAQRPVEDSKIKIKNILYMLIYCYDERIDMSDQDIEEESIDDFDDILDVLIESMCNEIRSLIDKGLFKQYNKHQIVTQKPHGRIDIAKSYQTGSIAQQKLYCIVNEKDINNEINIVIKTAIQRCLAVSRKKQDQSQVTDKNGNQTRLDKYIRRLTYYSNDTFDGVDVISDISHIEKQLKPSKLIPDAYRKIYGLSQIILRAFIEKKQDADDALRLLNIDKADQLHLIYQHFITNLIRREFPQKHPEYDYNILGDKLIIGYDDITGKKLEDIGIYRMTKSSGLNPDGQIEVIDKNTGKTKTWIAIDTKFYEQSADRISIADKLSGVNHSELGKSLLYAWAYRQYNKEANVKSIVIIARNKNKENPVDIDWKLTEMYIEKTEGPIFETVIAKHLLDRNFKDIKSDIINIIETLISDNEIDKYREFQQYVIEQEEAQKNKSSIKQCE